MFLVALSWQLRLAFTDVLVVNYLFRTHRILYLYIANITLLFEILRLILLRLGDFVNRHAIWRCSRAIILSYKSYHTSELIIQAYNLWLFCSWNKKVIIQLQLYSNLKTIIVIDKPCKKNQITLFPSLRVTRHCKLPSWTYLAITHDYK